MNWMRDVLSIKIVFFLLWLGIKRFQKLNTLKMHVCNLKVSVVNCSSSEGNVTNKVMLYLPCKSSARSILRPCWAAAVKAIAYSLSHLTFCNKHRFIISSNLSSASCRESSASCADLPCNADENPIFFLSLCVMSKSTMYKAYRKHNEMNTFSAVLNMQRSHCTSTQHHQRQLCCQHLDVVT